MRDVLIDKLVKCLVEQISAVEFADEELIDSDFAVALMESVSAELGDLDAESLGEVQQSLTKLASDTEIGEKRDFVSGFLDNIGVEIPVA